MRVVAAFFLLLLACTPAQAGWIKIESAHFIGFSDGDPADLKADIVRLEQYDALLRSRLSVVDNGNPVKLSIYFIRNVAVIDKMLGGPGAAGFYTPSPEGPFAVVPRTDDGRGKFAMKSDSILFHEYVHHVMRQYFNAAYPFWYSEGFAEFMGTTQFTETGKAQIGLGAMHRAYGLARGGDIPIKILLGANLARLGNQSGDTVYALGWLLTHYLSFSKERKGQLQKYLSLIVEGKTSIEAAEAAFGDLFTLGKELERYRMRNSIPYTEVTLKPVGDIALTESRLSDGFGDTLIDRAILAGELQPKKAADRAEALRKHAAKYPNDGDVWALLAQAEAVAGNADKAIMAADSALKADPRSERAMLAKAEAMQKQLIAANDKDAAKWTQARSWIIKANRINTNSAAALSAYYRSFIREGRPANDIALKGLSQALAMIPQDSDIRLQYVFALARVQQYADARTVLQVLADAPHAGKRIEAIRKLETVLESATAGAPIDGLDAMEAAIEALKLA
jgi:tetratricopeptide (TPR) repeat protein